MKKTKSINELLKGGSKRISDLRAKAQARTRVFEHVCAALPVPLAQHIVSAGLEDGQLTIGVAGAAWAARLRYVTDTLRAQVGLSAGIEIQKIRIRVAPPRVVPPRP